VALGTPDSHAVGQEWADLTGGAANSGFGVGTGSGNLCGSPGCGDMLDGSAFGLVGTGTNLNQDGLTSRTYIENSITIDITLAAGSPFALSQITSVDFQYGTGSGEGDICSRPIATTTSLKNAVITGCPYNQNVFTNHIWRPLVEKAGYKIEDIPKNWDAFYDFFKGVRRSPTLCFINS
jgi:hypothetical protein